MSIVQAVGASGRGREQDDLSSVRAGGGLAVTPGQEDRDTSAWPPQYAELLSELRQQWQLVDDFHVSRKLAGGRSGAAVYAVDVACPHYTGHAILKVDAAGDPDWGEKSEAELHQMAFEDAPGFAERHLPRLIHAHYGKTQIAILSTIASGGLQYAEAWLDCSFARQLDIVRRLSIDILEDWNADYSLSEGMHDGADLLSAWLGYRIVPDEGGRLHGFMADELGVSPDAPSLLYEGRWYPNPLAFATRAVGVADPMRMRAVRGHCHGDLHGLNVLVGRQVTTSEDYYLIDLALYQPRQYLFYDHAYFEIATLLNLRESITARTWDSILAQLRRFQDHDDQRLGLRSDDFGLMELIRGMRGGIDEWVGLHEINRRPSMESQVLLARVAAGLNFAHKHLPLAQRQMAFVYAAANLKDYVKLNRLDWPKTGAEKEITISEPQPKEGGEAGEAPIRAIKAAGGVPEGAAAMDGEPGTSARTRTRTDTGTGGADGAAAPPSGLGGFLGELRRRNVVKVAGIYIVLAWLAMRAVTVFAEPLALPAWADDLVAAILAAGFVASLVAAWGLEFGPAGLQRRTLRASGDVRPRTRAGRIIDYAAVTGIAVIAAIGITDFVQGTRNAPPAIKADATGLRSLAVLPFRAVGDADGSGFADGLTIELANTMDQTGRFRMPGITSSFAYKDSPANLRAVGEALGVDYVVEGEVRQAGEELRIAARLIQTSDGFTMWSGSFAETMRDVFEAQEQIAEAIGAALQVPLEIDSEDLEENRTADPLAYELFVEALPLVFLRGDQLLAARDLLLRSVDLAPDFGAAWAALALVYDLIPTYFQTVDDRHVIPSVFYRMAQSASLRSQRLDPDTPLAMHATANTHRRNRQWLDAEKIYLAALAADPGDHWTIYDYAILLVIVGKYEKASKLLDQAVALDPMNRLYLFSRAAIGWQRERDARNIETLVDLFRSGTSFREFILRSLIDAAYLTDDFTVVRQLLDECGDCSPELEADARALLERPTAFTKAEIAAKFNEEIMMGYGYLDMVGGDDLVLEIFERLATEEYPRSQFSVVPWIVVDRVGGNAAFIEAVEDMGLSDYWIEAGPPDFCRFASGGDLTCGDPVPPPAGAPGSQDLGGGTAPADPR